MPYKVLRRDEMAKLAASKGEMLLGANYWRGLEAALNAMEDEGYLFFSREGDKQDLFVFHKP